MANAECVTYAVPIASDLAWKTMAGHLPPRETLNVQESTKRIIKSLKPKTPKAELPKPTEENQHVLDLVTSTSDNLLLRCRAGTGKTTMFEMIEKAIPQQPILYIVFGTKNQKE